VRAALQNLNSLKYSTFSILLSHEDTLSVTGSQRSSAQTFVRLARVTVSRAKAFSIKQARKQDSIRNQRRDLGGRHWIFVRKFFRTVEFGRRRY
jgi:hypothetical protein